MVKRMLCLVIGGIMAIALHREDPLSRHETRLLHGEPQTSFVAPLTWLSSPDIRLQRLQPGVSTQVAAAVRVSQQNHLTLGILTTDPSEYGTEKWSPTQDYLNQALDGYSFSLVGLNFEDLHYAVASSTVDFIVAEPGFYASAASQHTVQNLATLRKQIDEEAYTVLGGVIICGGDRHDIQTLQNLTGKSFAGVDETSLEGWQIAWREFVDNGIDPYHDLESLTFLKQETSVVDAVMAGDVDAGLVRADTLHRLLTTGYLQPSALKVIHLNAYSDLPIPVSTRLYPEWAFAALSHIPPQLSQEVTVALLSMESTDPAAQSLNAEGWAIPADYQAVRDVLKQLYVFPFQSVDSFDLKAVMWHYKRWIVTALGLLVMGTITIYIQRREITKRIRSELKLQQSQSELTQRKVQLESAVAKLQNTQAQLIQTEKMSSLGQLMAGIAHEINNPVNFIHGNINYASRYVEDLLLLLEAYRTSYAVVPDSIQELEDEVDVSFLISDLPKLLKSMHVGSERIREIVQSLQVFSRSDEADLKTVDIHQGINSTLMILGGRLKPKPDYPGIDVIQNYGNLPNIECYAGQLNQVFMNILSNAIDALEEAFQRSLHENLNGSMATVQHRPRVPTIWVSTDVTSRNFAQIRIKNNGPSISPETQRKLFNPFFTTKPVGKGTGLGLSISYQIIAERHGGYLRCTSDPGEGVEFIIEIPIQRTSSRRAPEAQSSTEQSSLSTIKC
ncbi:MAG: PhnD/SsuA/transferrin family substrate-binding protein [Leptolyngbyaceae bacterium]|nr:PhnD/SsuA/transferrin family substrate-binding protein [Leptolyngbyaceae bacterium]